MTGFVSGAVAKGERLRRERSITFGQSSRTTIRSWTLPTANRCVEVVMNRAMAEGPAKNDKNGRNIFRTSETRSYRRKTK